ncbi:phage major capsid protein [Kitasatospora sp. NPDC004669]|uniref:phage major capsid protein n=1 Tax=Kitasatospora sp. NPDC004669 TaxID=3154555 RepID=UPI0033AE5E58
MNKRDMIEGLLNRRAEIRSGLDSLLETVRTDQRTTLTDEERGQFDAGEGEIREIDARVAELDEQIKRDEAAADVAKRYLSTPRATITSEPEVYRKGGERSYFRDLHLARNKGDRDAVERLLRNDRMVTEQRAISTVNGGGGEFVPPEWLEQDFIAYVRPGRITANLIPTEGLPPGTDSINIPKVSSGTATAPQAAQNTGIQQTDITTTSVSSPVVTIAGGQTMSLQLLEQSPVNIDGIVLRDLAADYARQLNTQVLSGPGTGGTLTGALTLAGTNSITYTSATPALGALYSKLAGAIAAIHTKRFLPPDAIVMHPNRWAWVEAQLDANNRPLVVPNSGGPFNAIGNLGEQAAQGYVGSMLGLPVYADATIPTNLGAGTNQDVIMVGRMSDLLLWESSVRAEAFQQTYAANLSVLVRLYNYVSFQPGRYPQSISVIGGTGLTAPVF